MEPVKAEDGITEEDLKKLADNEVASGGDEYPDQTPVPVEGSPA